MTADSAAPPTGAAPQAPRSYLYLEPGPLQQTGNPLDVAISGDAFFVVQGPNGPLYTRNGSFELGPGGELRTRGGGYPVAGAITVPPDAGTVTVGSDGTVVPTGRSSASSSWPVSTVLNPCAVSVPRSLPATLRELLPKIASGSNKDSGRGRTCNRSKK